MREYWRYRPLVALLALCAGIVGCSSPTAPARSPSAVQPLHHNIPATMDTGEGVDMVVWVCETQPRSYVSPSGQTVVERDHYISRDRCPEVPIS